MATEHESSPPPVIALVTLGIVIRPSRGAEQRTACPRCAKGLQDDALGVNIETGVYHCFRCGLSGRVRGDGNTPFRAFTAINDPAVAQRKREQLRATWRATLPLTDPRAHAVRAYLKSRALGEILNTAPKALRAHPALEYWEGTRSLGHFPAMVALFHGAVGSPTTLHVTYLREDGCVKAPVPCPKKIMAVPARGATKGGAIRLFDVRGGILGVAEGVESALSLHLIRKIPVWASYCADNLERIRLPEGLRRLEIGVDLDASGKGQAVAEALANRVMRWSSRTKVVYIKPELSGPGDLNDELRRRAG